MNTRYISASEKATILAKGVWLYGELQGSSPTSPGHRQRQALWQNFCAMYEPTVGKAGIEIIQTTQYDLMTAAINL